MAVTLFNRQLPMIPQQLTQKYMNVVDYCRNVVLSTIQQSANKNEARAYLNNLCSTNNGNNNYFLKIQELAVFIGLAYAAYVELYRVNSTDFFQQISCKIEDLIEGFCCDLMFNEPRLNYMIQNNESVNIANRILNDQDRNLSIASGYINEYAQATGTSYNGYNNNYNNNMAYNNPLQARAGIGNNLNNANRPSNNIASPVCRFDRKQAEPTYIEQPTLPTSNKGRYNRNEIFDTVVEPINNITKINDNTVKSTDTKGSAITVRYEDWKPTQSNPYLTLISASDVREFELVKGVVYERIKKGNIMDRSQHTLTKNVTVNTTKAVSMIDNLTRRHFSSTKEKDPETRKIKLKEFVNSNPILDNNLESAMNSLKSRVVQDNNLEKASYHRFTLYIAKPFASKHDITYILDDLSDCSDYALMADHLSVLIDNGLESDKTDIEKIRTLIYLQAINKKLTDHLNKFLNHSLGVDATIDSFATDASQIESHLQEHYGTVYSSAFRDFEYESAQDILRLPSVITKEDVNDALKDDACPDVVSNYVLDKYTVTFLGLLLSQLGIETLVNGKPYLITRDKTPVLYNIAASLYRDDAASAENSTYTNLIVTLDDVYLTLNKSYLGRDMYILSTF